MSGRRHPTVGCKLKDIRCRTQYSDHCCIATGHLGSGLLEVIKGCPLFHPQVCARGTTMVMDSSTYAWCTRRSQDGAVVLVKSQPVGPLWERAKVDTGVANSPTLIARLRSRLTTKATSAALPMPSCDLPNEYSDSQHECHLKRGGQLERPDARWPQSRTEVCEREPGEIQKNARCELPNGEL